MSDEKEFEIMAPVGSYESLMAAIQGGADSVYFGIEGLNMRSRSSNNFTTDDLRRIADICREHGIKSYLTVNTVIYGEDLPLMRTIIDAAKNAGVSAIIAADVAAMSYANSIGQEVHLSTQLNISNAEALKFYARFADVVVLARELNLTQVHEIYRQIVEQHITGPKGELIRIEMFAHGALCMAVSGKCYLSLHEMNASANRGACMQICRRAYTVKDRDSDIELDIENQYIMSPKDLKTGTFSEAKIAVWNERLRSVFNRGFWDGYYLGQRLGEWSSKYGSGATKKKVYVAKGIKYFDKLGVAEFEMESGVLQVGDEILITGPTTGALMQTIDEIRVALKPVQKTVKGERFSIRTDTKIRPSDRLYKMEKVQQEKTFE